MRTSSLLTGVYNPKAFIPHAASLGQAFAHCPRFPTAASRRSLGRVSVPVWLTTLSGQLPVIALVGRYPTNKLIGRGPLLQRPCGPFLARPCDPASVSGISPGFPRLSPSGGQVTHVLLTRSPLELKPLLAQRPTPARLACLRHAASVRPEPGSNSPSEFSGLSRSPCHYAVLKVRRITTAGSPPRGQIPDRAPYLYQPCTPLSRRLSPASSHTASPGTGSCPRGALSVRKTTGVR